MKQLLLIFAVVGQSVLAQQEFIPPKPVLITDPILKEVIGKEYEKPYGKFAPPMYLTKVDLAKVTKLGDFRFTKITDAGLKDVAKLQQLTKLDLGDTQITDACLPNLAKLQKLRELYLLNTKITYDGVAELRKAMPKCKIRLN